MKKLLDLSFQLAKAEFKLRNEGTYLGVFWYLLAPLFTFSLLFLIFRDRLGNNIPNYALYLLLGIIIFNLFMQSSKDSTRIILKNRQIVKSLKFNHKSLVLASVMKNTFSHFFELFLYIVIAALFFNIGFGILFYPIILIFFIIFLIGFSLIMSSLSVYFVDLNNVWEFVSRLIWLVTPIFYAIEGQTRLFYLNLFNPMYYFITISRDVVIYSKIPELWMMLGMGIYSLLFLVIGILIFNKMEAKFAEKI